MQCNFVDLKTFKNGLSKVNGVVLIDKYGRPLLKLRIVVNSECNFNCFFCHFEGQNRHVPSLTPEDIGFTAEVAMRVGVMDFKLTGGEPLLRNDITKIIEELSLRKPKDLSLTTNGYLLGELASRLREAGLMRLNVSLHSLKPERYAFITGTSPKVFNKVIDGLLKAKDAGFSNVKLNMVVTKVNVDEVDDLISFAAKHGFSLQLIELMPVGYGEVSFDENYVDLNIVVKQLMERGRFLGSRVDLHNRPLFSVDGVKVEIVKNYMNPSFCAGCTTMRLTSDGWLKTCLYKPPSVKVWDLIKNRDIDGLIKAFQRANELREPNFKDSNTQLKLSNIKVRLRVG